MRFFPIQSNRGRSHETPFGKRRAGARARPVCEALEVRCVLSAGDLDPSFDLDGVLTTDLGGTDEVLAVAVQSDGKIVAAGRRTIGRNIDVALIRYEADGALDGSFGAGGKVFLHLGDNDIARAVAIQADGKIVVAGSAFMISSNSHDFLVARFNADGTPDTSFDGDGMLTHSFFVSASSNDFGYGLTIQPDGKILAVGSTQAIGSNFGYFAVARYNSNGSFDTSFGINANGRVITQIGGGAPDRAQAVALQGDGKIVVAGTAELSAGTNFGVARYNTNGSLDASFGSGGAVMTDMNSLSADEARTVAIQADGKIIVAGESFKSPNSSYALARYNTNGTLDATFDGDGKVLTNFVGGSAYGVVIQQNGRIVVAGTASTPAGVDYALIRYNATGAIDTSFGANGRATADLGTYDFGYALALQADGKLVMGGYASANVGMARFEGDAVTGAPVAHAGGPYTVGEGGLIQLDGTGTTDPNQDPATLTYEWDLDGDGAFGEIGSNGSRGDERGATPTFSAWNDDGPTIVTVSLRVTDRDLLSDTAQVDVVVTNVAPTVSAGANTTINEGGALSRNGSFADPGRADTWSATVDYGDGSGTQSLALNADKSFSLSHSYADNGTYTVTVKVTDDDGMTGDANFVVTVSNVTPAVDFTGPASGVRGQLLLFAGSFTDPGADTWSATVDYGDGSGVQSLALNADKTFQLSRTYVATGDYTITVVVQDDDGAAGSHSATIPIRVVEVQPDPLNAGKSVLAVGGTLQADKIQIKAGSSAGSLIVTLGKTTLGTFSAPSEAPFARIAAFGQDGDDQITVATSIALSAWLDGQAGNDKLNGGSGPDVLKGGAGDDQLYGNAGRDLLLGGVGSDRLQGNGDEDIFIAGTTSYDANDAALAAILAEWTSSRSRATRIQNLTDGTGSSDRVNGDYFLRLGSTVFHDTSADILHGATSGDWLFYDPPRDRLRA